MSADPSPAHLAGPELTADRDRAVMLLVRDNSPIEQFDMAVHSLSQTEVMSDRHDRFAFLCHQLLQDPEYLFAGL